MGGSSKRVTVGYRYFIGIHFALCHGVIDRISKIRVAKRDAWIGTNPEFDDNDVISISNDNLFGGESREGGVSGTVTTLNGSFTQQRDSYLVSMLGSTVPAFRGVACAILNRCYIGINPYPKEWAFTTTRIKKNSLGNPQWNVSKSATPKQQQPVTFYYIACTSVFDDQPYSSYNIIRNVLRSTLDFIYENKSTNRVDIHLRLGGSSVSATNLDAASLASLKNFVGTHDFENDNFYGYSSAFDEAGIGGSQGGYVSFMNSAPPNAEKIMIFYAYKLNPTFGPLAGSYSTAVNIINSVVGVKKHTITFFESLPFANYFDPFNSEPPVTLIDPEDYNSVFDASVNSTMSFGGDMNPAHIIRECLTDTVWGLGIPEIEIDSVSFEATANTLFIEKFGLSILWTKETSIYDFINNILSHIEGSLFVDRSTGKWNLKLARPDYDSNTLLVLDESNISRIENYKKKTASDLVNQVTIVFEDATTNEKNSVTVQNLALIQQQGVTISETFNFEGISNSELANRVAMRELRNLSTQLIYCTIYCNREAYDLNVGDVFKLNWSPYGISNVIMRIGSIEFGEFDNNQIKINCVQDVFGVQQAVFGRPPDTSWDNPASDPADLEYPVIYEAPYYELAQIVGDDDAQAVPVGSGYVALSGVAPSQDSFNMVIYNNIGGYEEAGVCDFCPTAVTNQSIGYNDTTILLTNVIDIDLIPLNTYAMLDVNDNEEIIKITAVTETSDGWEITVGRGCLDTVRKQHSTAQRIFFSDAFVGTDSVQYLDGETPTFKLATVTTKGQLPIDDATPISITLNSRKDRPYPPAKVRVNGVAYPTFIVASAQWEVTWAHRDRLQQTASIIDDNEDSIGPEAGTTYICELYDSTNTLIHAHGPTSGTSVTFTTGNLGSNYGNLTIKLHSVRDGYGSWQKHEIVINRLSP